MKNVGVGSAVFEDKLLVELEWLFSEIDNDLLTNNGFPREFHHNIDVFIGSCLNLWIFGYTFSGVSSKDKAIKIIKLTFYFIQPFITIKE